MPLLPLPTTTICPSDRKIALWHATETADELLALLPPSAQYGSEYTAFRSARRQMEWLAARVLLHRVLQISERIGYHASGRPQLIGSAREISISHSHGYVAVAIANRPIGIDIEMWGDRAYKLRNYFLADEEMHLIHDGVRDAVRLWSAKESVFKRFDRPGTTLGESIRLSATPDGLRGSLRSTGLHTNLHTVDFPEFVLSYTTD